MTDAEYAELDLAAALAEIAAGGLDVRITDAATPTVLDASERCKRFRPSSNWAHGGPIIERERISLDWDDDAGQWYAQVAHATASGPTPLVAAMRAYLAIQR